MSMLRLPAAAALFVGLLVVPASAQVDPATGLPIEAPKAPAEPSAVATSAAALWDAVRGDPGSTCRVSEGAPPRPERAFAAIDDGFGTDAIFALERTSAGKDESALVLGLRAGRRYVRTLPMPESLTEPGRRVLGSIFDEAGAITARFSCGPPFLGESCGVAMMAERGPDVVLEGERGAPPRLCADGASFGTPTLAIGGAAVAADRMSADDPASYPNYRCLDAAGSAAAIASLRGGAAIAVAAGGLSRDIAAAEIGVALEVWDWISALFAEPTIGAAVVMAAHAEASKTLGEAKRPLPDCAGRR